MRKKHFKVVDDSDTSYIHLYVKFHANLPNGFGTRRL